MIIRSKAPLRLGLAGGGTDVSPYSDEYGGYVLNATIDMYAYCTLELHGRNTVSFYAADLDESFETDLAPEIKLDGKLDIHKATYNRVVRDFNNGESLPLSITTYSDAPPGCGLGSSSTLVTAILRAYQEFLNLPLGEYDLAQLSYEIERHEVGISGGKQDQYAATFGGVNFMEFYADNRVVVNPLRVRYAILNEFENSMLLYHTGVSRESARIIDEQTSNITKKDAVSLAAMHEIKKDALIMKEAILKGDMATFEKYLDKSWKAKKAVASSISNSYIDEVYETAMAAGALSGKISGAGGGGFMMFMVDPVNRLRVIRSLEKLPGTIVNFHFTPFGAQAWKV